MMQRRLLLGIFIVASAIITFDATGTWAVPWPVMTVALTAAFLIGYAGVLSLTLRCPITAVSTKVRELGSVKKFIVDSGLLILMIIAFLLVIFSYLRNHGVESLPG